MIRALLLACVLAAPALAQTSGSARTTRQAYGARLDAAAQPNDLNTARVNNRVSNRINNRLSLRIERYRPGQAEAPTDAFRARQDDGTRSAPVVATRRQQQEFDEPQEATGVRPRS